MLPRLTDDRFWLSGQANFIFQTNPPFFAKYSGTHSLGSQLPEGDFAGADLLHRRAPERFHRDSRGH